MACETARCPAAPAPRITVRYSSVRLPRSRTTTGRAGPGGGLLPASVYTWSTSSARALASTWISSRGTVALARDCGGGGHLALLLRRLGLPGGGPVPRRLHARQGLPPSGNRSGRRRAMATPSPTRATRFENSLARAPRRRPHQARSLWRGDRDRTGSRSSAERAHRRRRVARTSARGVRRPLT
jgi:hypothetical protein